MYFDSSIPQGYGVGSSGALGCCACMINMLNDKITVLENLTREKLLKTQSYFFGNGILLSTASHLV